MSASAAISITAGPIAIKRFWRPATLIIGAIFGVGLIMLTLGVLATGYVRFDIQVLLAGQDLRSGGWLSRMVVRMVGLLPTLGQQQFVLSLMASAISGVLFAALYDRLRRNGWFVAGTVVVLVAVVAHAGVLYTFTASSRPIPLYFAFAILIPFIRQLEDVGDVQAAIGLGMVLPLLMLAGPTSALLIPPLAIAAALADPDARRDPRAFVAMLLVAVLPSIIVIAGILGYTAQAGFSPLEVLVPYAATYGRLQIGNIPLSLASLTAFAPCLVVPIAYCFWPNLPERRHVVSAVAVVVLPVYLAVARMILNTTMSALTPPLALIAAFVSWLAIVRLPSGLRILAVVMLIVSAAMSWITPQFWDDPAWRTSMLELLPGGSVAPPLALRPSL